MEALSISLQPYKKIVGQTASLMTIGQFFSGAFVCKDIFKRGTTQGVPATPFIGGIVIGSLMLKHGILLNETPMLQVSVAAIFLNIVYTTVYYIYSPNRHEDIIKPLGVGAVIVAIFFGYAEWEDPSNIKYRYGLIVTVLMLLLIGSPLIKLKEIIAKRDASSIPFPLTFTGTIVTFLWLLYGIILLNNFMIVQNMIGFTLSLVQLVLIVKYPARESQNIKKEKKIK